MSNPELEQLHRGGLTPWRTARFTTLSALKRHLAHTDRYQLHRPLPTG
jgi:hypothetical protein